GLLVSAYTRQIANFAGMMNFVVFPMFFLSSALYPLWKLRDAGADAVYWLSVLNPFTDAVELIRFAASARPQPAEPAVVARWGRSASLLAARGYDPQAGQTGRLKRA